MERITEEQARMSKHLKSPRRLHRRIMRRLALPPTAPWDLSSAIRCYG